MYKVYSTGKNKEILHDVRLGIVLADAVVTRELNTVNSFVFSIYKNHNKYNDIMPMDNKTLISVYQNDDLMFLGRVLQTDGDNPKKVTCEGVLGYFNDVLAKFSGTFTAEAFLRKIIETVNAKRENKHDGNHNNTHFVVGNVDVSGNVEISETEYFTCWEWVSTKLINELGGYIRPRFLNDGNIAIDYLKDFDEVCEQEVRVGKNISSKSIIHSGQEIFTSIIPVSTNNEVSVDLTSLGLISFDILSNGDIETHLNSDVGEYVHKAQSNEIYSKSAVEKFGIIQKYIGIDKELNANELALNAVKTLSNNVFVTKTYTYKIIDLSRLNKNLPSFKEGEKIRLCDEINSTILCTKIIKNINNPTADEIVLGAKIRCLTKG